MLTRGVFRRLCHARDVLREMDDRPLSIRQIAASSSLSPFHFIRQFHALFGETPHQLRIKAKLERAKELLAVSDYSVTDVCMEVGFTSLGSFSDLFNRRVGMSPSLYRRRVRASMPAPRVMPPELTPGCLTLMGAAFAILEKQSPTALSDSGPTCQRQVSWRGGGEHP